MPGIMEYFKEFAGIDRACSQLGIAEAQLLQDIKTVEKWLKDQKHLPQDAAHNYLLEKFVLGGKGDLKKSMLKLDTYFTIRSFVPDIFSKRDPLAPDIIKSNEYMYMGFLPGLTPDGARVLFTSPSTNDASRFSFWATVVRTINLCDIWLRDDPHVNKLYILTDSTNGTISHATKISMTLLRQTIFFLQNAYPISLAGVIFLNIIPFASFILETALKPLFKKKIGERFLLYSKDRSGLYEKIPLNMMPKEYGGDGPSLEEINQSWINIVNENREWLLTSGAVKSDESSREGDCPYKSPGCVLM